MENGEVLWSNLKLDSKTQIEKLFNTWCLKVMGLPRLTKRMYLA